MSQLKVINVQKWPELENSELISFYDHIRANKLIKLDWNNPGRIDPKLYFSNKTEKKTESHDENSKESSSATGNYYNGTANALENVISSSTIDINKFDLFDEDDFNETEETNTSNEIFNLRLIHSNTRSRSSDNKVASMDKILDDIRKKYETEHKQVLTDEVMLMGNDNFKDESNVCQPSDQIQMNMQENYNQKQKLNEQFQPEHDTSCNNIPNEAKQKDTNKENIDNHLEESNTTNTVEAMNAIEVTESEMLNEQNVQIDSEKVTCEYIETSTPYQQANDSDMLADRKYETAICVEQIDSIKSNNRDDSSDDKTNLSETNQLSDTTEEIETFTRKETNQYRVLSMPESAPMLEHSSGKFEDSSEKNENAASNEFKSDQEPDQDQTKEVDSTTYKSGSSSPKNNELSISAECETNLNLIKETPTKKNEDAIETSQKEFLINEKKIMLSTTDEIFDDDPLISRDLSSTSNSQQHDPDQTANTNEQLATISGGLDSFKAID